MPLSKPPVSGERRMHQRVLINMLGRFMLSNRKEYPCQVLNMSPGGMALVTPVIGAIGERIIAYVDNLGRIEGKISRVFGGGFAVSIHATGRKRDKFASQLTWLANRDALGLPEDRVHDRLIPRNPKSHITLADGRTYDCAVIDMSLGGAAIAIDVRPLVGSTITLGKMRARIVRHLDHGLALEFTDIQNIHSLTDHFGAAESISIPAIEPFEATSGSDPEQSLLQDFPEDSEFPRAVNL